MASYRRKQKCKILIKTFRLTVSFFDVSCLFKWQTFLSPIVNQTYSLTTPRPHILSSLCLYPSLYLLLLLLLIFSPLSSSSSSSCQKEREEIQTLTRDMNSQKKIRSPLVAPNSSPPSLKTARKKKKDPLLTNYIEPGGYRVLPAHKQQDSLKMLM